EGPGEGLADGAETDDCVVHGGSLSIGGCVTWPVRGLLPNRSGSLDPSIQLTKYRWIRSVFWMQMLDNVTINQLRAFVAVCDQGSFSGAARKLGRAQSAISHAVKALESAFDVELFERNTRKA